MKQRGERRKKNSKEEKKKHTYKTKATTKQSQRPLYGSVFLNILLELFAYTIVEAFISNWHIREERSIKTAKQEADNIRQKLCQLFKQKILFYFFDLKCMENGIDNI